MITGLDVQSFYEPKDVYLNGQKLENVETKINGKKYTAFYNGTNFELLEDEGNRCAVGNIKCTQLIRS